MGEKDSQVPSDLDIIRRVLRGKKDAYAEIMARYQRAILAYVSRMIRDRETAMDLSQEIFLKAYNSLRSYDPSYKFSTWLYKIASNHVIDTLRRREPHWVSIDDGGPDGTHTIDLPDMGRGSETEAAYGEKVEHIEVAIRKLPPAYRQLVLLRHVHECSYEEMARICSLPLGTVKNRLFRAREMLKAHLKGVL